MPEPVRSHLSLINRLRSRWPILNFRMNKIFTKKLSCQWRNHDDANFVHSGTIPECDGQTDRDTIACIACYATTLVQIYVLPVYTEMLELLGNVPQTPYRGIASGSLLRNFLPPDLLTSCLLTWNPEYAPELGFRSRVFHPCDFDGAAFSTPSFSVNPPILIIILRLH